MGLKDRFDKPRLWYRVWPSRIEAIWVVAATESSVVVTYVRGFGDTEPGLRTYRRRSSNDSYWPTFEEAKAALKQTLEDVVESNLRQARSHEQIAESARQKLEKLKTIQPPEPPECPQLTSKEL